MSEHDDEPREDFGQDNGEELYDGITHEDVADAEQTPAEAAAADGSDELIKKAEKAQTNYAKRIRDIFGDNAPQHDCPTCHGLGLVWSIEEPQQELVHPDNLVMCDACNGYGEVITGSKNPQRITTVCIACSGNGYKTVTPQPENVTPIQPIPGYVDPTRQPPVMGFMGPDGVFQPLGTPQAGNG